MPMERYQEAARRQNPAAMTAFSSSRISECAMRLQSWTAEWI
jgi:hypothetical protein